MKIAIYDGAGCSTSFKIHLKTFFPNAVFLNAKAVCEGNWEADLFVMPGGRDCPYHDALKGAGNDAIRSFVEQGGTYLGICAGAYYGCKLVDFDQGQPLEVVEQRELCFFSGSAVGPAYGLGTFEYSTHKGARAARLLIGQKIIHTYYNGGPFFSGDLTNVLVLASYADLPGRPPAVIACKVGKGKAILSGVHLEAVPSLFDALDPYLQSILPSLHASDLQKNRFIETFVNIP